jgi:transcriptional regulator with XRE-family HTH domain
MDIGQKIRDARLAKGMTQEELGRILGVQKSAIAKYENGRIVNIKRSTLKKISDVLGIRPSELIFEASPVETADLHAKILMDHDVMDMIAKYYSLDIKSQAIVKKFIYSLDPEGD